MLPAYGLLFLFDHCVLYLSILQRTRRLRSREGRSSIRAYAVVSCYYFLSSFQEVIPWIVSEVVANLSINIFFPGLFAIIVYFMVGLRMDDLAKNLFILVAECILVQLGSIAFALVAASMVRVFAAASLMANAIGTFFFLSAGFAILKPPAYVNWIRFISIYWYGFRITAISQFRGRIFACPGVTGIAANQCVGDQVLVGLTIPVTDPLWIYFVRLTAVVIGFNALSAVLLIVGLLALFMRHSFLIIF
jgi:multisubunit Na+/H+ antiporter MnhC subunit